MKAYKLIEKGCNLESAITYHIKPNKDNSHINVLLVGMVETGVKHQFWLSTKIKETKRGWTITAWLLTVKPIKIFLPRENFEKVEIG